MRIACIGSRQISDATRDKMRLIGRFIAQQGWTINSGNALGSDYAFAAGANEVDPQLVNLYMPWPSYNKEHLVVGNVCHFDSEPVWSEMAKRHHPIYDKLTQGVKKMMDRNAGIVMNSDVVLAYLNHNATGFGGTGHGWRVAAELKLLRMDVSTLESGTTVEQVCEWLKKVKEKLEKPLTGV